MYHISNTPPNDESYDESRHDVTLSAFEDRVLRLIKSNKKTPRLEYRESSSFHITLRKLNKLRRKLKMIELPSPLDNNDRLKVYRIEPMIQLSHPEIKYAMNLQDCH